MITIVKKKIVFVIALLSFLLLFGARMAYADDSDSASMYRLYNRHSGEHFYTALEAEKDFLVSVGWRYEGIGWKAPTASEKPVYRLYNPNAGDHHYTLNAAEKDMLVIVGWNYEGIGWYSDDKEQAPIYRQYNPNAVTGTHNYTGNAGEKDMLVSLGWSDEGIGWYGTAYDPSWIEVSKETIVLDPGHTSNPAQGVEPLYPGSTEMKAKDTMGAMGMYSGVPEYQMTLSFAFLLRKELESRGYEVILTRVDHQASPSCIDRSQVANENHADVYLRIHGDSFSSAAAEGATMMCTSAANPAIASMYSANRALSEAIINRYCAATGIYNRGVWERDDLTGNNWSQVPCTLIELGFMSNPSDDLYINNADNQIVMARAIADGIEDFLRK